jgi:hypothetical protein
MVINNIRKDRVKALNQKEIPVKKFKKSWTIKRTDQDKRRPIILLGNNLLPSIQIT